MVYFTFIKETRLGNWLFQYAAAMSLSDDVSGFISCPSLKPLISNYSEIFGDKISLVDSLPKNVIKCTEKDYFLAKGEAHASICLYGFFQSEKFFDERKVRDAFRMADYRRVSLFDRYGDWLRREDVTGISVRRGDYLRLSAHYTPLGMDYYKRCIELLPECNDFIVCSDDIGWCKSEFPKAFPNKNFLFIDKEDVLNQLYIQSLCKNNIIPNSTFSWWGAWLNETKTKKVFMPNRWYGLFYRWIGADDKDIYFRGVEKIEVPISIREYLYAKWVYISYRVMRMLATIKRLLLLNTISHKQKEP